MVEKVNDRGAFGKNLDELFRQGFISQTQREHLAQVIEGGNATIHRGFIPSADQVHALLDIAENVVEALYITPARAKVLKGKIPPRRSPT